MTALDTAINLHQQGRVEEAEAAYREILAEEIKVTATKYRYTG